MPMCNYPGGCENYAVRGGLRCDEHQLAKGKAAQKNESAELKKLQLARDAQVRNDAERAARDAAAQAVVARRQRIEAEQAEVIRGLKRDWSAQIQTVVAQVLVLRQSDPTANAGNNQVGNTEGGTGNPIKLAMTGPTHNVTPNQVLTSIAGFDSSDSGVFKFRRKDPSNQDILVHATT